MGQSGRFGRRRDGVARTRRAGRGAASRGGGGGVAGLTQAVTRAAPRRMVQRVARRFSRPADDSLVVRVAALLVGPGAAGAVGGDGGVTAQGPPAGLGSV